MFELACSCSFISLHLCPFLKTKYTMLLYYMWTSFFIQTLFDLVERWGSWHVWVGFRVSVPCLCMSRGWRRRHGMFWLAMVCFCPFLFCWWISGLGRAQACFPHPLSFFFILLMDKWIGPCISFLSPPSLFWPTLVITDCPFI